MHAIVVAFLSALCAFVGCRDATEIAIEITTDVTVPRGGSSDASQALSFARAEETNGRLVYARRPN
jgi:hypothetical protein